MALGETFQLMLACVAFTEFVVKPVTAAQAGPDVVKLA